MLIAMRIVLYLLFACFLSGCVTNPTYSKNTAKIVKNNADNLAKVSSYLSKNEDWPYSFQNSIAANQRAAAEHVKGEPAPAFFGMAKAGLNGYLGGGMGAALLAVGAQFLHHRRKTSQFKDLVRDLENEPDPVKCKHRSKGVV